MTELAAGQRVAPLTIRAIETVPVLAPLGRVYRGSFYHMTHRATVVTRVITEDGIVGEAYAGDEDKTLHEIQAIIRDEITPRLVGLDAFATERCHEAAWPSTFDILRDRRLGLVAVACVDTAIWDAVGKALGQPLWRLWGGYRDRLPMVIIGGYYDGREPAEFAEEIAEYREMGLAGCKFKVGGMTPEKDAERVRVARDAGGDDFILTIDANQGYTAAGALDLCRRLEGLNVRWFEEPCRWHNDKRALRDVRTRGGIPIAAGQSEYTPSGCRDLMETGSIDVCNFDASWTGGPTVWRRTAAIALAYDVEMGHHEEPQVASHLLASQQHGTYVECFHPDRDPFWWNIIGNRPQLVDGEMPLPTGPGLGWDLDWEYIERHRADR